MGRLPQTNTTVSRYLRQQKRVVTRMANATPYALSGTSVTAPGLMKVDERLVAGDPAGSRVELDSAGLRKYAADGTTVQVDLTGDVAAFSGLITGSEIIAGTAGAARVELDSAGLRVYAADGTTVLLDTADDATIRARGNNMAVGHDTQASLTTGTGNTAVGDDTQFSLTDGDVNTAVGYLAQLYLTTGEGNTAVGYRAQASPLGDYLNGTRTASFQTSIGPQAGQSSATQVDGITTIGYGATAGAANATSIGREARADHAGSIALGYQALTTQINQVMVGPRDVEITSATKGLVLVSPDGTRYRVTVANGGALAGGGGSPPPASETVAGSVELATPAETITGTDDTRATTPAGVAAARAYTTGGWVEPTLTNSWVVYSAAYHPPGYRKMSDGTIMLRGMVKSGAFDVAMFTLPVGYRPTVDEVFTVAARAGVGQLVVTAAGVVRVNGYYAGGSNLHLSLSGVRFSYID